MKALLDYSGKGTSRDLDSRFELATRTFMTSIGDLNQEFDIKLTNLATKLQAQIDEIRSKSSTASSLASTSAWGNHSHDDSAASSPQYKRFKSSPAVSASTRSSSQPPTVSLATLRTQPRSSSWAKRTKDVALTGNLLLWRSCAKLG